MQPSLFAAAQWTVSTLTRYIRETIEADIKLQDVWVEGEISNVSKPASGHIYFTLKDAGASLRCVIWKMNASRIGLSLMDGLAVAAHGRIGVYDAGGQYQLYADQIRPAGEGALFQEFLRLKERLEAEGLFSTERKRTIPSVPSRIGIVTSPTGAALQDVLHTLRRRLPMSEVVLCASPVQGAEAAPHLMQALILLNHMKPQPDVILLVRGGGSMEDLWAFNDENLVRAVRASEAPVICGVGHETDFTLSDFAADLRAPTPTAAAELATSITKVELADTVRKHNLQIRALILQFLANQRNASTAIATLLRFESPEHRIQSNLQNLDDLVRRIQTAEVHRLALQVGELGSLRKRLAVLSPLDILARGYAVVTLQTDGSLVRKVAQARGRIQVRVSDGRFDADVARGEM